MSLNDKIIYGLERVSDAFKTLLWEKAKDQGISPIQIQLLLFIANHKTSLANVTQLAIEFNVTKPTISDAIKVLIKKKYLIKDHSSADSRSYYLLISQEGEKLVQTISSYSLPFQKALSKANEKDLEVLYSSITVLISELNKRGVIQIQRSCLSCRFHNGEANNHFCNLLNQKLTNVDIRLDCADHEPT